MHARAIASFFPIGVEVEVQIDHGPQRTSRGVGACT